VAKEVPWWKKAPAPAPGAQHAVRPADVDGDGDSDGDVNDEDVDDDEPASASASASPSGPRDLADGEQATMQGSGAQPYVMKNTGGVYSCSCPAWRNAGGAIDRRSCKHLRALRGDAAETARTGSASTVRAPRAASGEPGPTPSVAGNAPPVLLAHPWDNVVDLTGWWMSEKLDGVRAYWDGGKFVSRLGNQFFAPDWFVAKLPDTPLDGELWGGRKKFQRTVSIARRQDKSDAWRELTYVVFDAPSAPGAFEQRLEHVRQYMEANTPPHARWHPHELCTGLDHLRGELARVEALGGEGLMMRQPGSKYEVGRSWTLRKVKTFHDAEARVIGHERGTGRHGGRLGSLQCEMPNGTVFNVGTGLSDAERNDPPPVGTIITYRYQELSNDGVPRFPSYVGVRVDFAWPATPTSTATATATQRPQSQSQSQSRSTTPAPIPTSTSTSTATATATATPDTYSRTFSRGEARWSIQIDGRSVIISDQTPGEPTSSTTRRNTSAAAAWRDAERLIAEKISAGYTEII
jgi:DNA ligase-1